MDYDDNDFHSQNFHLAGEGSTKFPSVLRPFALPKFDFDDNLQSHLRFDSLVETEVFLGIESNQDNHWIEDFSRGSTAIEFNSSAAESCSISRHNNVWSEATSSESVEMLLKSVGQEETIAAPTIIEESDACDELGCLTKQMEHSLKHDDNNILSKTEDVTNLESTLPPDEIAGNSSSLKEDVGVDHPLVEDASHTRGGETFDAGCSRDYNLKADSGKGGLHVSEGNIYFNKKCDDANKGEADALAHEHLNVQLQDDSFPSKLRVDNLATSTQHIVTSSIGFSSRDVEVQMAKGQVSSKEAKMDNQNKDGSVADITSLYENPLTSASKVETVAEINVTEVSETNVEESSNKIVKGHSELSTMTGSNNVECSGVPVEASKCEDMLPGEGTDTGGDRPDVNMLDVVPEPLKIDSQFERHVVEVSNISAEVPSTLEPKDYVESRQQSDNEILVHRSEASLSSIENNKISENEGLESSNSHMGGISNVTGTYSSADLDFETKITGPLGASRENLSAESHVPIAILTESTQISDKNNAYGDADVYICNQDVSVSEKENTKLPNVDSETLCKEAGSSSFGDGNVEDEVNASTVQCTTAADNESASDNNALANPNLVAHEESDDVSLPFENGVKIDVGHNDSQISVPVAESTLLEEKEEAGTNVFSELNVSSSVVSCQVEAAPSSTFASEEGVPPDSAGELLCKNVDQSLPTRNKPETQSDPQDVVANEVSKESTKEMNISTVLCKSTVREGHVSGAVVVPENQKEAVIEKYILPDAANASGSNTCREVQECNEATLPLYLLLLAGPTQYLLECGWDVVRKHVG
ncbi:hypothetical protein PanWU01x14_317740 [Parasponia andersonii]|uniref:Uncharacterized protein n=1 Tax=Parasponia andersonii TaxID=3476 RepID=A0A2P5AMF6_PARAD|nr:hypothetical protein PanWU01x14_317740 [Parasponia andersonii]